MTPTGEDGSRHLGAYRLKSAGRLERRSPTGIARERETCTNDAGCQRSKSARTAWSAGLRPASRGSAKPALMTPVQPTESRTTSARRGERTDPIMWVPPVEASGRHRPPEPGEGLAFHPHVGHTPGEPHGPAPSYQISPTVKPSGKGSDGSTEYWAIPVIQAVPLIVGTTAGTPPTVVVPIRRPTNSVPTGPK